MIIHDGVILFARSDKVLKFDNDVMRLTIDDVFNLDLTWIEKVEFAEYISDRWKGASIKLQSQNHYLLDPHCPQGYY